MPILVIILPCESGLGEQISETMVAFSRSLRAAGSSPLDLIFGIRQSGQNSHGYKALSGLPHLSRT
jgi:hypothetical protein